MFEAEFAHKLPELKEREDYLTSSIFGALKYLPPKNGIFPIIGEAFNYKLGKKFNEYFALRGICLEDIKNVELHFWPKSIEYGEPDIIMILHGSDKDYAIIIEVKYFSYKHGEGEEDQLKRYLIALSTDKERATFTCDAIKNFSGDLLAIIYLTQYEATEEIADTLGVLAKEGKKDADNKFFHLKWQSVACVIEDLLLNEKDLYRKRIYGDIYKLLDFKNLTPFKGFSGLPEKIEFEQLFALPAFFNTVEKILNKQFNGYSPIPKKLNLDYDETIYYGG